jgi:hypothetical protein
MELIMFDYKHYVPVLKGKAGELDALSNLSVSAKENITPLIDVPRHVDNKNKGKSFQRHIDDFVKKISSSWSGNICVDLFDIPLSRRLDDGSHPVEYLFERLAGGEVNSISVTGLDRDDDYNKAIKEISDKYESGVCVRLQVDDLEVPEDALDELDDMLGFFNLSIEEIDLVLDLRSIRTLDVDVAVDIVSSSLDELSSAGTPRTISLTASSIPQSLSEDVNTNSEGLVERKEVLIWNKILQKYSTHPLMPAFGDYTTVHPDYVDLDMRIISNRMGPSIRYTSIGNWYVIRGSSFRSHPKGYKQYYDLAKQLVSSSYFMGEDYSYGDSIMYEKSQDVGGTGNPGTWVKLSVNHHMTYISECMSSGNLS